MTIGKGYWKIRALYYEALYRINFEGNRNDPFMLDDIDYPAYFLPIKRTGENEGRSSGLSNDGRLSNVSERE